MSSNIDWKKAEELAANMTDADIGLAPGERMYSRSEGRAAYLASVARAMKTKLYNWDVTDALKTPEARAAYIEAAIEENDPDFLTVAFGDVAKAEGMTASS